MAERELIRRRETEASSMDHYEVLIDEWKVIRDNALNGKVVTRGKEMPWQQNAQALVKFFYYPTITDDVANKDWMVFVQDIRTHSGKHRHQGGLGLYVLEGKGWSVVDGKRFDWEAEDLILLPVRPNGVEHQHFNAEQGKPCKWLAFIYTHYMRITGHQMQQEDKHPEFQHG